MRQVVANGNRQGVQALTTTREHQLSEEAEIVNRKSRIVNVKHSKNLTLVTLSLRSWPSSISTVVDLA